MSTFSKKLASSIKEEIKKFFPVFDENVREKEITQIMNIDESAIFFEMTQGSTLDIKGQKVTGVFSTGASKQRCTLVIGIKSDGNSAKHLIPIIILKNSQAPKEGKLFCFPQIVPKDQKEHIRKIKDLVSGKKLLLLENSSGWNNSFLMVEHIIPFLASKLPQEERQKTLLLLHNCSCHTEERVFSALQDNFNIHYFPPDCTPVLQPVDVSVVKSLKTNIRKKFREHVSENFEQIIKPDGRRKKTFKNPTKSEIITWILDAYQLLTKETINSGFIQAGLLGSQMENIRTELLENKIKKFYVNNDFVEENLLVYPNDPVNRDIIDLLQSLEEKDNDA